MPVIYNSSFSNHHHIHIHIHTLAPHTGDTGLSSSKKKTMRLNKRKTAVALKCAVFFLLWKSEKLRNLVLRSLKTISFFCSAMGDLLLYTQKQRGHHHRRKGKLKFTPWFAFTRQKLYRRFADKRSWVIECETGYRVFGYFSPRQNYARNREKHTRIEMNVIVLHFRFQTITISNRHYHFERLHEHRINSSCLLLLYCIPLPRQAMWCW